MSQDEGGLLKTARQLAGVVLRASNQNLSHDSRVGVSYKIPGVTAQLRHEGELTIRQINCLTVAIGLHFYGNAAGLVLLKDDLDRIIRGTAAANSVLTPYLPTEGIRTPCSG